MLFITVTSLLYHKRKHQWIINHFHYGNCTSVWWQTWIWRIWLQKPAFYKMSIEKMYFGETVASIFYLKF